MRWGIVVVALAACGRLHFADLGDGGGATGDGDGGDAVGPPCVFTSVTAGLSHTCAIDMAGGVWCWGLNDTGQTAPGLGDPVLAATRVALPLAATQVSAGRQISCALLSDQSVWCWGDNSSGELGTTSQTQGPAKIPLPAPAAEVAAATYYACARLASDGSIACWGDNTHDALGNTGPAVQPQPAIVAGTVGSKALAVGHRHNCAIDASNQMICWGRNQHGQLGDNTTTDQPAPVPVMGLNPVQAIGDGGKLSCAIEQGGDLRCWGFGYNGQLGTSVYTETHVPGAVATTGAIGLAVLPFAVYGLHTDGTVITFGQSTGDGIEEETATPRPITIANATALSGTYYHACAMVAGKVECWGSNGKGELGRGTRSDSTTLVPVSLPATVDMVGTFFGTACALAAGKVYCWGENSIGEVGDGTQVTRVSPVEVASGLSTAAGVAVNSGHSCAWGGGTGVCWGRNANGELGNGVVDVGGAAIAPVTTLATAVTAMTVGTFCTCAVAGTSVQCWGDNTVGELGNGTTTQSASPVTVMGIAGTPTTVALGGQHACAISSGNVYCWGNNFNGEVGDNSTTNRTSAVAIALPTTATQLALASAVSCALLGNGDVYCWGGNNLGQLGLGDTVERHVPTKVTTLPGPVDRIERVISQTCVHVVNGSWMCWGLGTVPDGSESFSSTVPVAVPSLAGATAVSPTAFGGCAIIAGALQCWGGASLLGSGDSSLFTPQPIHLTCGP